MGRLAALATVLFLTGPGTVPAGAEHVGELGCGALAPFDNECVDPDPVEYDGHATYTAATLGYVGRVNITLEQRIPWLPGLTVRQTVSCDSLGVGDPACGEPFITPSWWPFLLRDIPVTLRCRTWPMPGLPAVQPGPWGPWGCSVAL